MPVGAIVGAGALSAGATVISGSKAAGAQRDAAQQSADVQRYMYDTSRADQAPYREVGQGALYKLADMYGVSRPIASSPMPSSLSAQFGGDPIMYGDDGSKGFMRTMIQSAGLAPGATAAQPSAGQSSGAMTPGYGGFQESPGYAFRRDEGLKAIERMGSAKGARFSPQTWKAGARYADNLASAEFENYANALRSMAGIGQTSTSQTGALGVQTGQGIAQSMTNAGNARASSYANTGAAISNFGNNMLYAQMSGAFNGGGGVTPSFTPSPPITTPPINGGSSYPGYGLNPNFA